VKAARSAGVAAARSRNAGTYLCNYIYWRALEAAGQPDGPGLVIFIHVPPIRSGKRRQGRRRKKHRTAARLNDLVRAGEAIVLAMMSLAAAGRRQSAPTRVAAIRNPGSSLPGSGTGYD
jgi:pyroglutamyl-peptidase